MVKIKDIVDLDEYCAKMSKDGEWADHIAVMGVARYLGNDIMVVTSSADTGPENKITWIVSNVGFSGSPIILGHIWENHYKSLEIKTGINL